MDPQKSLAVFIRSRKGHAAAIGGDGKVFGVRQRQVEAKDGRGSFACPAQSKKTQNCNPRNGKHCSGNRQIRLPIRGPRDYRPFYEAFRQGFPNLKVIIEDMVAEGDKVAARCSVRGSHEGEFLGRAATQSPVEITGITIVRIYNGKIVEAWNNFDFMTLYKQVGHLS